ncbi:MAG: peptidase and in kexin sedolisin, partial [Acidimicrobiaceae bacterium]|nr:peptidase and in kexin sedolisin [Acidimicrobiaceae bacterium]
MKNVPQLRVTPSRKHARLAGPFAGASLLAAAVGIGPLSSIAGASATVKHHSSQRYIVQGAGSALLRQDIVAAGGRYLWALSVVQGAEARLDPAEVAALSSSFGLSVTPDTSVSMQDDGGGDASSTTTTTPATTTPTATIATTSTAATSTPSTSTAPTSTASTTNPQPVVGGPAQLFPSVTGADQLWSQGDTGQGVTVAVIDSGINAALPDLAGRVVDGVDLTGANSPYTDEYGHGTFVAGLIAGNGASTLGQYTGEAPGANLVSVKVAGADGSTSMSAVIQGISWVIAHQGAPDNIKVLNLSLGTIPTGPAATEPLDQAVDAAWNAGITVVTSAGNSGPANGTITSPGDDPLAITVGALDTTGGTPSTMSIPGFSSVGPTAYDGTFKPDIVAPGRSVVSLADPGSTIYEANPSAQIGSANFVGTGTSFSAAIASGEVALLLEAHPSLSPDRVKGALLLSAVPGPVGNPFVDGHGVGEVAAAVTVRNNGFHQDLAAQAETTSVGSTVSLSTAWAASSWNPASWGHRAVKIMEAQSAAASAGGSDPQSNGMSWNGMSWNGMSWNGMSWNGMSWNGMSWNG